jgi:2-haloacid dehalogenase
LIEHRAGKNWHPPRRNGDLAMSGAATEVYVFDAYGTLFDVHAAIARHRAIAGPDADRFSEIWRVKQLEYAWTLTLAGHYVDFWTLTERALDYAFMRLPSVSRTLRPMLLEAYLKLDAFADARASLTSLKARGARIAILSNGSSPMLAAAVQSAAMATLCDAVLSVDAVRMYKPQPEVYALVTEHFGIKPDAVIFASSNRWDIMGAAAFGYRPVWVNRSQMPDEYTAHAPMRVVPDLLALTELVL